MKKILLSLLLLAAFAVNAKAAGYGNAETELRNLIIRNLRACQNKNMEQYLDDIDTPLRAAAAHAVQRTFDKYDLSYTLVSFQLLSCDGRTARVKVVQETRKIRGPDFADNRCTVIHIFKKRADGWKVTETQLVSFELL